MSWLTTKSPLTFTPHQIIFQQYINHVIAASARYPWLIANLMKCVRVSQSLAHTLNWLWLIHFICYTYAWTTSALRSLLLFRLHLAVRSSMWTEEAKPTFGQNCVTHGRHQLFSSNTKKKTHTRSQQPCKIGKLPPTLQWINLNARQPQIFRGQFAFLIILELVNSNSNSFLGFSIPIVSASWRRLLTPCRANSTYTSISCIVR